MFVSKVAVASFLAAISARTTFGQEGASASSTYHYKPGGVLINGTFLPGPDGWPGSCNDVSAVEQSPIAIDTTNSSEVVAQNDFTPSDYTFNDGSCTYDQLIYSIEDNGVKVSFPESCAPSFTMPDDPSLISISLFPLVQIELGEEVFGKEAGKTYNAAQFHIHSKSEHTIDGTTFEAELHIVHLQDEVDIDLVGNDLDGLVDDNINNLLSQISDGSRAASVIGYTIKGDATSDNSVFEPLLLGWESIGCGTTGASVDGTIVGTDSFSPYDFRPSGSCLFNYDGGLTTPGCDQIVEWNLFEDSLSISSSQMDRLLALINYSEPDCTTQISWNNSTSRPVQPLGSRTVNYICPDRRRGLRKGA